MLDPCRSRSWRVPAGAVRHATWCAAGRYQITHILRYGNQNEVVLVKVENKDAIEIIPAFDQMARGLSHLLLSYERGTVFLSVRETWKALSVSAQD